MGNTNLEYFRSFPNGTIFKNRRHDQDDRVPLGVDLYFIKLTDRYAKISDYTCREYNINLSLNEEWKPWYREFYYDELEAMTNLIENKDGNIISKNAWEGVAKASNIL